VLYDARPDDVPVSIKTNILIRVYWKKKMWVSIFYPTEEYCPLFPQLHLFPVA
jgi:hypothetical protein